MRRYLMITLPGFLLLLIASMAFADEGSGDIKLGYVYLDEEGNRSVNQSSFNYYDGVGASLENFRYNFDSGIRVNSDLRNINLENRNLAFGISRPGLFGADIGSSQFRRIYDFEGDKYTKRNLTSGNIWLYPSKYLKLFGKGSFNKLTGQATDLFGTSFITIPEEIDYQRNRYSFGATLKHQGKMFHAEYSTAKFEDKISPDRNQLRENITLRALATVPKYDWLAASGVFNRFETEYDDTGFKIKSTTARGSILAELSQHFKLNYSVIFNRAGSDSNFVETDNLAHTVYLTYVKRGVHGLTIGYRNDVNDDYEDVITANSFYFAGWYTPNRNFEFKAEYGSRAEEVDDGSRLVGDRNLSRFKFYGKYNALGKVSYKAGVRGKNRKNDQLNTEMDYTNIFFEATYAALEYVNLSAGYSYSTGNYDNLEQSFEFTSQQAHCDLQSMQYKNFTGEFGVVYYRSHRDLDVESFNIRASLVHEFPGGNRIEASYNVYNFDDFNFLDRYYTENIVEVNIIKAIKF